MKITKAKLKQIIKEELEAVMKESGPAVPVGASMSHGSSRPLTQSEERKFNAYKDQYSDMSADDLRGMVATETDPLKKRAMNAIIAQARFGF